MDNFKLERYFASYEFKVKYLLSPSDCEGLTLSELLEMASPEDRRLWEGLKLSYTESQGLPQLRQAISGLYQSVPADDVLVAVPEEAIFIAMHTLLRPGDHVVCLFPAYQSLYELARSIGCEVTLWHLQPGEDGWKLDLQALERSLRPETRLLVINFPHNPTGYLPTRPELQGILDLADRRGLYVFSDEMYRLLEYQPEDRLPAVADIYTKGISLSGLSKSFALPGLRLGWLACQDTALLAPWQAYKDYTTICNSAPSEILGLIAVQHWEQITGRSREIVLQNLQTAGEFFTRHLDRFAWLAPRAGSVAFPRYLGPGSVEEFCQQALDRQGVMILPGNVFDFPGEHFRVGLGRMNFAEALQKIDL